MKNTTDYTNEYTPEFVDKWDELINWKGRYSGEGEFFVELLNGLGAQHILDAATGTGYHSILLSQRDFNVTSLDGSMNMLLKAQENGVKHQVELKTVHANWLELPQVLHDSFDALICLGNSFTHVLDPLDQERVLQKFNGAISANGYLILDVRNYDYVTSPRYQPEGKLYYTGKNFKVQPTVSTDEVICLQYSNGINQNFQLTLNPVSADRIRYLLEANDFKIIAEYGDFLPLSEVEDPHYLCFVAQKN